MVPQAANSLQKCNVYFKIARKGAREVALHPLSPIYEVLAVQAWRLEMSASACSEKWGSTGCPVIMAVGEGGGRSLLASQFNQVSEFQLQRLCLKKIKKVEND